MLVAEEGLWSRDLHRIALAVENSPLQQSIEHTLVTREAVSGVVSSLQEGANRIWQAAGEDVADFIERRVRLNRSYGPASQWLPIESILAQSDVQTMLHYPFIEAAQQVADLVRQAWDAGASHGSAGIAHDLASLGLDVSGMGPDLDPALLNALTADVMNQAADMTAKFLAVVQTGDPDSIASRLPQVIQNIAWRSGLTLDVAGNEAMNEAKTSIMKKVAAKYKMVVKKMWVTRFGPGTCDTCAALHGTIQELNDEFPSDESFGAKPPKVYVHLNHPPRHPNCRCVVVPYLSWMGTGKGPTPSTMKKFAKDWHAALKKAGG